MALVFVPRHILCPVLVVISERPQTAAVRFSLFPAMLASLPSIRASGRAPRPVPGRSAVGTPRAQSRPRLAYPLFAWECLQVQKVVETPPVLGRNGMEWPIFFMRFHARSTQFDAVCFSEGGGRCRLDWSCVCQKLGFEQSVRSK